MGNSVLGDLKDLRIRCINRAEIQEGNFRSGFRDYLGLGHQFVTSFRNGNAGAGCNFQIQRLKLSVLSLRRGQRPGQWGTTSAEEKQKQISAGLIRAFGSDYVNFKRARLQNFGNLKGHFLAR